MFESENSDGTISEKELIELVDLFAQFKGAPDPFSKACKEAKTSSTRAFQQFIGQASQAERNP